MHDDFVIIATASWIHRKLFAILFDILADVSECDFEDCDQGTCEEGVGSFQCLCDETRMGRNCDFGKRTTIK